MSEERFSPLTARAGDRREGDNTVSTMTEAETAYRWRRGDVFTNGTYRWEVAEVHGEKAVLRSCGTSWATTIPSHAATPRPASSSATSATTCATRSC